MLGNLELRILTAVVVLALLLAAMFLLPNSWWSIALVVPLLVAGHEWARLAGLALGWELMFLAVLVAGCGVLWSVTNHGARSENALVTADRIVYVLSAIFWFVIVPYWLRLKLIVRDPIVLAAVGMVVLLPTWLALVRMQNDPSSLLVLLAVVWIADSAAYITGRAWGRRKLAPAISPGKTWEGVAGAFAAVTVYALCLSFALFFALSPYVVIAAFLIMTGFSIVGDLFESWIKRSAGVKDSGSIFPGHGGMLDRIDAVTAAMPVAALIFV